MKTKKFLLLSLLIMLALVVSACAAPTAPGAAPAPSGQEAVSDVEDFTTPHPILSDIRVRRAIAHCIDRDALIASVYPYVEDPSALLMDSFLPKTHWAYSGPYDFPWYDPEAGKALLEEAGWTGSPVRSNVNGDILSLKFTTTSAQFRQTWSAVMIQNLAACGIQIIPTYAPASWWFGDTTGLSRRDFELGAFAWVGQADPAGRTLYACDQIPLPSNNWEGQNFMGWCNPTASDAIVRANNTLIREERIAAYDIVQREFAKDVVSIPVFQRAEAEAWSSSLTGIIPDATEYATTNLHEWALADGGDTIVIGMTQEPDSMWSLVSSMAAQRLVDRAAVGVLYSQYNYDFQPGLQGELSTLESGLASNEVVEVTAGDKVYDATGMAVELAAGVRVIDSEGNEVEYSGEGTVQMNQLTVTYKLKPFTWSDGTPGTVADMKLGVDIDCNPDSGATTYDLCNRIGDIATDVTYSDSELAMTIEWLPGNQYPLYHLYPFYIYPSQRVLSDGRVLADVPAAEWATLPEVAERPLSYGAYVVKEWNKGQSIVLEANPYFDGEVATPNVIYVFVADTNQAVAQLLNGDVDYLDDSTLGAGAEVQTVIDAAESTGNIQYEISGSATWEHIDINLATK
ncbi:MAG: ABC transporter substrate-binding protein [Caldilinea sp.]